MRIRCIINYLCDFRECYAAREMTIMAMIYLEIDFGTLQMHTFYLLVCYAYDLAMLAIRIALETLTYTHTHEVV